LIGGFPGEAKRSQARGLFRLRREDFLALPHDLRVLGLTLDQQIMGLLAGFLDTGLTGFQHGCAPRSVFRASGIMQESDAAFTAVLRCGSGLR
jgi:hypothetical protein